MTEQPVRDDQFSITEEVFASQIRPLCDYEGFEPVTIVEFIVTLPFQVPIPREVGVSVAHGADSICLYRFALETITQVSDRRGVPSPVPSLKSRVEMSYITANNVSFSDRHALSDCFEVLIEELNVYLLAYLIKMKDLDVYRVSREMLDVFALTRVVYLGQWAQAEHMLFWLHTDVEVARPLLEESDFFRVVSFARAARIKLNPFIPSEELFLTARRYLKDGFYREAVIFAQSSVESFLNALYLVLAVLEGKSDADAEAERLALPFLTMVKTSFHQRLGGTWQVDRENTDVGRWYKQTFLLRHRIIHAAYFPDFPAATEAVDAAGQLRKYVVSLLSKKKQYRSLRAYLL